MTSFSRVLIANRGEIARRIQRACAKLGLESIAIYSEADRDAPFVAEADDAICIGPAPAAESYLNIDAILAAASAALSYSSECPLSPGTLVRVPLGARDTLGIVWDGAAQPMAPERLKPIAEVLDGIAPMGQPWRQLVDFAARFTPRASEITLDGTVLLFTLLVAALSGAVFGLAPALSLGTQLTAAFKEGGQATASGVRQRLRGALVVAQVALSFMLLVGAGLMLRSFYKLQQVSPGFDPERVIVMRLSPNWSKYKTNEQYRDFGLRLLDRVPPLPGVLTAAISNNYPLNPQGIAHGPFNRNFIIEGQSAAASEVAPQADFRIVSPDYLSTLRLPLLKGRFITEADHDKAARVAVINQTLARHRWGNEDPVGRRISYDNGENWVTVVGVIGDARNYGLERAAVDEVYAPIAQTGGGGFLLVRTAAEPLGLVRQLREAIYALDAETAIDHVRTLEEARSDALASPRLTALLLGLFALLALVITATGLAGVMALLVNQRTHELGIRLVLGAAPGKILMLVLRQGLVLVALGLALGFVGALALRRVMAGLLFAVEPGDPLTWLGVSLVLSLVAAAACFLPARRVTLIDPLPALRSE
mgnify:CR=1 FL=1